MNGIMTLLIVLFGFAVILILNITGLCIKKDEKVRTEWRNKILLEVPLILTSAAVLNLILIESEKGQLYQISHLSYGTILIKLFISILLAILMVETVIFRLAGRTLLKHSILGFLFSSIGKKIKPICSNMSQKKKAIFIILTVLALEAVYLAAVIAICMDFNQDKIVYLLILLPGIINFFYMLSLYSKLFKIHMVAKKLQNGEGNEKVDTDGLNGIFYEHAECINHISDGLKNAITEKMKSEQLKIELITNVSHDIKTPLTSIINYVDLMKKENIENQKIKDYLEILDKQSLRLKDLTDHVIEASKAATGNVEVKMTEINVGEMLTQALGEYENKFSQINLQTIYEPGESVYMALGDGALLWRVLDNLFSNVRKYTLEGTRFYVVISEKEEFCVIF